MPAKNLQRVAEGGIYCHVYNKGVENRNIFADDDDYQVFLDYLEGYLSPSKSLESTKKDFTVNGRVFRGIPHLPKNYFNRVELLAYSLSPDHFHLLLHQKTANSLQAFLRSLCTRYSIYFNKKYNRTGSLFAGTYKSVVVDDEKSLLLLSKYFHAESNYSSLDYYNNQKEISWVNTKVILSVKTSTTNYLDFVEKYQLNQKESELLTNVAIENIDKHLERRNPESKTSQNILKPSARIPELVAASTIFVLLLGLSLRSISATAKESEIASTTLGTKTVSTTQSPTNSPKPKTMLKIKYAQGTVDIREKPTAESKEVSQAHRGDTFEFVSKSAGWYEIKLPGGSTGFILSIYIEEINNS